MKPRVYAGVDLGGAFHQVQVTNAAGERLGKSFRIGRGKAALVELKEGVRRVAGGDVDAVYTVEATQNYWLELVHPLQRAGAAVYLVSPAKSTALRTFYRRHTKNDAIDAEALSRLQWSTPSCDPRRRVRRSGTCCGGWCGSPGCSRTRWPIASGGS